jgi:hypothetical protein
MLLQDGSSTHSIGRLGRSVRLLEMSPPDPDQSHQGSQLFSMTSIEPHEEHSSVARKPQRLVCRSILSPVVL